MREIPALRVVVVVPLAALREGLRAILEAARGLDVVAEFRAIGPTLHELEALRPDVVLLDLEAVSSGGGPPVLADLIARVPQGRVVLLTALEDPSTIRAALGAGAHEAVPKDAFAEQLVSAVRGSRAAELVRTERRGRLGPPLSGREVEILRLVARGRSNREIASALDIAEGTVKSRLRRIFLKLDVAERSEAAIVALKQGFFRL
jgi:DNA-binding NarL/FixJ family response regulator